LCSKKISYCFKFIDSPVSDRFISPAPGQPNIKMGKQIAVNENRQYFSVTSKNNGVSLPTVTGPLKKIGTLGLFFRKVSYFLSLQTTLPLKLYIEHFLIIIKL